MTLFKRSVISEIASHGGVVMSTIVMIWLSVLLVRLIGQAAEGLIGADIVLGIAAFSSITALPTVLTVSLFVAVLITVSRNYRESEMVVWFTSGLSLTRWISPVLMLALPATVLIASLTLYISPWAYAKIEEYRQRYEQRSDLSKIATGQFIETSGGQRVFFIEPDHGSETGLGRVFIRLRDHEAAPQDERWRSLITAEHANFRVAEDGRRYIDLGPGSRYDLIEGTPKFRLTQFDEFTMLVRESSAGTEDAIRAAVLNRLKARPLHLLLSDGTPRSDAQVMWRISMPLAALNLALLAIPLGAVNPRMGRSINIVLAALIALLYMNVLNLMRGWVANGTVSFMTATVGVNLAVTLLCVFFFWRQLRVKKPKPPLKPSLGDL